MSGAIKSANTRTPDAVRTSATPAFVVAHGDYAWSGDILDPGRPALPTRPSVLHAVLIDAPGPRATIYQDYADGISWRALCGTEVLAITPTFFDDASRSACPGCGVVMNRWLDDADAIRWDLRVPPRGTRR